MENPLYTKCKLDPWKKEQHREIMISFRDFELNTIPLFAADYSDPLLEFVLAILNLEVKSDCIKNYYWSLKTLVTGYLNCGKIIAQDYSPVEQLITEISQDDFKKYIIETIDTQKTKQNKFESIIDTTKEGDDALNKIREKFDSYISKLEEMIEEVNALTRVQPFREYARAQYETTLAWLDELFDFVATHISAILLKVTKLIYLSLEDNYNAQQKNLERMNEYYCKYQKVMLNKVYFERKKLVTNWRKACPPEGELQEIEENLKSSTDQFTRVRNLECPYIEEVRMEGDYYKQRMEALDDIFEKIKSNEKVIASLDQKKSDTEKMYILKRRKLMSIINVEARDIELKYCLFKYNQFLEACERHKQRFQTNIDTTKKAIVSFFACNGSTHEMHTDLVGKFYLDRYGRKVYRGSFGMARYLRKDNALQELKRERAWFDHRGRRVRSAGREVYRRAESCSAYRLHDLHYLVPARQQSEPAPAPSASMSPGSLTREQVDYAWEVLAPCLLRSAYAVCADRPTNHVASLAHRIITCKYGPNIEQQAVDLREAMEHKEEVLTKETEELTAAKEKWKSLQLKAPKAADFDDAYDMVTQQVALRSAYVMAQSLLD